MIDLASWHEATKALATHPLRWRVLVVAALVGFTLGFGYAAVEAKSATVPIRKVILKSEKDTQKACEDAEIFWMHVLRCEGWDGTGCHRWGIIAPFHNNFTCYQYFFMSTAVTRGHVDCNRKAHYWAQGGRFVRFVRRGTSKWKCVQKAGLPS